MLSPEKIGVAKEPSLEYSEEWFKRRAFSSLKRIADGVWDYSDSLLLYIPGAEDSYEEIQKVENPYHTLVTEPEREYLQSVAERIVTELPQQFRFLDLGPGTEHKEQFIFDEARRQQKAFTYIPVDISEKFLALSTAYAAGQGIPVQAMRVSFEELPQRLEQNDIPNYVSLGLTYSNFDPETILKLLQSIAGHDGSAFINAQLQERVDLQALTKTYAEGAVSIAMPKLKLLGLDVEQDIERLETDTGIRSWCVLKNSTPQLETMGITAGARLLIFESLRPTRETLESDIRKVYESYTLLDTGASFVGTLLKNT